MTHRLFPLLWLTCFAAALMPMAAFEAHFVFFAVSTLAAGLSFAILKSDLLRKIAPLATVFLAPVFGFWLAAFSSVLMSDVPYVSFIYFCFFSVFPLTICCTLLVPKKQEFFAIVGWGLAVIFAALSLASLLQFFFIPEALLYGRAHWPFADPNSLSGLLTPGFFAALGLMLAGRNRVQSNLGLALAILIACALLTTGSRGGIIGLLAGLFVFSVFLLPQLRRHKRCLAILVAAVGLFLGLANYSAPEMAEGTVHRVSATISGEVPVLWSRPAIWEGARKIIDVHPWTGTGIGTFFLYYPEVRGNDPRSAGRMAHSDPLQFWAEMGILAPLLFYTFIALALILTVGVLVKLVPEDDRRVHVLVPFCGLGAVVLHTHITFHFYVLSILMVMGLLTGYWFWQVRKATGEAFGPIPAIKLPSREVLKIALIVPLLGFAYCFMILQGSHILFMRGDMRGQSGDLGGFARDINMASRMAGRKNAEAVLMAAQIKVVNLQAQGGIARQQGVQQTHDEALALLSEAERLNPRLAGVPHARGLLAASRALLGLEGEGSPEAFFLKALALEPMYFPARIELARYYLRKHDRARAFAVLEEGWKWREAAVVPDAYYDMLAAQAMEQGRHDLSGAALKQLALSKRAQEAANPRSGNGK